MATPCPCATKKCDHENGTCGKPIENAQEIQAADASGGLDFTPVGPWVEKGVCEECYKRNRRVFDMEKVKEFVRWFWS
jgi:hypothetical protein